MMAKVVLLYLSSDYEEPGQLETTRLPLRVFIGGKILLSQLVFPDPNTRGRADKVAVRSVAGEGANPRHVLQHWRDPCIRVLL